MMQTFFAILGQVGLTVGVAAAAAWGLFRLFGEQWLSARFSERLEALKHAQQRELEQLRLAINTALDRNTKLHEREFAVLPDLWEKLNYAFTGVELIITHEMRVPDLDGMSAPALAHFLEAGALDADQRNEITALPIGKINPFVDMIFRQNYKLVWDACTDFSMNFAAKGIFVTPGLRASFRELEMIIWGALNEREAQGGGPQANGAMREHRQRLEQEGSQLIKQLETDVQAKLWGTSHVGP